MDKILKMILNKKEEPNINVATVVTLSPFTIKFPPDNTAIPCIATSNLHGIIVGSRVLITRYKKQFIATAVIQSNVYPVGHVIHIIKPSDTSRSSTTTLTDDPHLTITLPAKGLYYITATLFIAGSDNNQDFKSGWTHSNITSESYNAVRGIALSSTSTYTASMLSKISTINATEATGVVSVSWTYRSETFFCSTSTNDGTITLKWAQNTSGANAVTLKTYSSLLATKIENN